MKRVVSGIMLTLLLTGMLTLAFSVQLTKAEWTGTVYIRADGSIDPPDAPITTYDNITYTLKDDITSSWHGIIVERDDIVVDGAGHTIQGMGDYMGIYLTGRSNVTIKNMEINTFDYGIQLYYSLNNTIVGNNITANDGFGIWLHRSSDNSIVGNNITNNYYGIHLDGSSNNNRIVGNNITANNELGIYLDYSSNNTIVGNNIADNKFGIWFDGSSDNSIIGNTIITNNYYGIYFDVSSYNSIVGNSITNNWLGIYFDVSSYNNSIVGNNITNNDYGIELFGSGNNSIVGNNVTNNEDGIWLYYSLNNTIVGNNVTNNGCGIELFGSGNNSIVGNNITANNELGIHLHHSSNNTIVGNIFVDDGLTVHGSYGNVVVDNVVNGKPLVYLEESSGLVVGDAGQVILVRCSNITVENLNLSNTDVGIQLLRTNNTKIANNNITANDWGGIELYYSLNNTIVGNNITANDDYGIYLDYSLNNTIVGNNITANNWYGIWLHNSSYNSIVGNNVTNNWLGIYLEGSSNNNSIIGNNITNNELGIRLYYSSNNNRIVGNNITANDGFGIWLHHSSNNTIVGNNVTNNEDGIWLYYFSNNNSIVGNNITNNYYGIYLDSSSNNILYHNNFIDNIQHAHIPIPGYTNVWDDGYPSGGNYWSDYAGVDANGDGIGDTPYVIDENNVDRYPLMKPWSPIQVVNATVEIYPNALNLMSRGGWVTAHIELPEGYDAADINVSTIMLNGTVPVDLCAPIVIGDYDNDSIPDLMVGFNGTLVSSYILSSGVVFGNVTLTLTGQLYSGTFFEGSDIILVSSLTGDINVDGKVDMRDLSIVALAFGSYPGDPRWNPEADINGDNKIDMRDLVLICKNFGNSYS